jgi:hypothetical protein
MDDLEVKAEVDWLLGRPIGAEVARPVLALGAELALRPLDRGSLAAVLGAVDGEDDPEGGAGREAAWTDRGGDQLSPRLVRCVTALLGRGRLARALRYDPFTTHRLLEGVALQAGFDLAERRLAVTGPWRFRCRLLECLDQTDGAWACRALGLVDRDDRSLLRSWCGSAAEQGQGLVVEWVARPVEVVAAVRGSAADEAWVEVCWPQPVVAINVWGGEVFDLRILRGTLVRRFDPWTGLITAVEPQTAGSGPWGGWNIRPIPRLAAVVPGDAGEPV